MELLKKKILSESEILPGSVLRVDSFLNHQVDVELLRACGEEWYKLFKDEGITKILTIESSGIGIACLTAQYFGVPVVYAKKSRSATIGNDFYSTKVVSYTHGQSYEIFISKKFISPSDKILIIDDFVANGSALKVLINLAEKGGATVVGAGVAIEKLDKDGGKLLRELGYRVESLAKIKSLDNGKIEFAD
ncbi:MAG: xanthine phosphoribosyltransferase [Ruminococcaceae bacterium]|nr:xanthine phosphoribosyltransferase [Oscillospiraceae bacterium]